MSASGGSQTDAVTFPRPSLTHTLASSIFASPRILPRSMPPAYPQRTHGMRLRSQGRSVDSSVHGSSNMEGSPTRGSQAHLPSCTNKPVVHNQSERETAIDSLLADPPLPSDESSATSFSDPSQEFELSSVSTCRASISSDLEMTDEPFLSLSAMQIPSNRIWGRLSNHNSGHYFDVYEDLKGQPSPRTTTPDNLPFNSESDKENRDATESDFEEQHTQHESPVEVFDYDQPEMWSAFSIPFVEPLAQRALHADGTISRNTIPPPAPVQNTLRVPIRFSDAEQEPVPEEVWQSAFSASQVRDLRSLNDILVRGEEQRAEMGRQFPMREENAQPQTNLLLEARRITSYQRSQARRDFIDESDDN